VVITAATSTTTATAIQRIIFFQFTVAPIKMPVPA
jgi:hypothetical protein